MKKNEVAQKMIQTPKSEMIREHKRIIPELRKAGLSKEARRQEKELKSYKQY